MNTNRRAIIIATCCAAAGIHGQRGNAEEASTFQRMLAEALSDPEALEGARAWRERPKPSGLLQAAPPPFPPSARAVAPEAIQLIIVCEVTSPTVYDTKYREPVWPGGDSGATIGIGYDVGYCSGGTLTTDWKPYLDAASLKRLQAACGKTGAKARDLIANLGDISVDWSKAHAQFANALIPRYTGETLHYLPNASLLSEKSLGALVSLVYNRGASFGHPGDRYTEMRAIKAAIESKKFSLIPQQFRAMQRLWPQQNLAGLRIRRRLEAQLFEDGLA
jgi:GH24 family phage-related lysozyme (muramidase)